MRTNFVRRDSPCLRVSHKLLRAFTTVLLLSGFRASAIVDPVLLNAPSGGYYYFGMYSPLATAASFTLSSSFYVSTIDVVLRTPVGTTFTTFTFSLQDSLADPITTFATQELTALAGAISTRSMNINQPLEAGTYFVTGLVPGYSSTTVTPGDVDGWMTSTGVYSGTAGTIENGVWYCSTPPTFLSGAPRYVAPAFTVHGYAVPEPSAWAMLAAGTASLLAARRRRA